MGQVAGHEPYRFRIQWPGAVQETEDPYSFDLLLSEADLHLFNEGRLFELAFTLGANAMTVDGVRGTRFAVWAPNARAVSVIGDFNTWDNRRHPMRLRYPSGVWELFVPRVGPGHAIQIRHGFGRTALDCPIRPTRWRRQPRRRRQRPPSSWTRSPTSGTTIHGWQTRAARHRANAADLCL